MPFLKTNFGDKMPSIEASIKQVAKTLPYKLESIFDQQFGSLGLDIGIGKNGDLYLFEVETGPGTEFGTGQIAMIKADYYKYIRNKLEKKESIY
ncbi:hypothetical protein OLD84_16730 [Virgibacillus natechei]|nr:YheC/YheD family protein [Virgibacillus natechei]UZD12527.1 hypothetical protein OLD84_16730 [Virgibacillus natechei]